MISISIDPTFDTPEKLRDYAARFDAGPQWQFLTGELEDVVAVEKAFNAFRGAKMNHEPLTLIRVKEDDAWLRIDGIASANEILTEYRNLMGE
jgi:protein SCO1/2